MIVADTNVIFYLVVRGAGSDAADRQLAQDPEWVAPRLWHSEFRNAVTVMTRARRMSWTDARAAVSEAETRMRDRERDVESAIVLDCIERSNLSAYDSEFVALALQLQIPLVTADRQIIKAFPAIARALI